MASPNQITVSQLRRLVGTPALPVLVDVSIDEDFNEDPRLIPTAIRHPFGRISELVSVLAGRRVVIICQKGLKLSAGAAALLRAEGVEAEYLEGGNLAWREDGGPLLDMASIPNPNASGGTLWVTRNRPKIDRIACPWFIRRFIDRDARFLFVAPGEVLDVAEKYHATPFDHHGTFWSHRDEGCTFDTFLLETDMLSEPLKAMAAIVRGGDTGRHELAPEVAGFLAVSLGLSRMYKDDLKQLEAGLIIYDALFRWARDARDETHDWPAEQGVKR